MREQVLREFFEGKVSAAELARDVAGSIKRTEETSYIYIQDMKTEFAVTTAMAISLCDAVAEGHLPPGALHPIGFALMGSDKFCWDGDEDEVLADVIADWSCPEVNYPLNMESVRQFKAWLTRAEPYPAKPALASGGNVVSRTEKRSARPFWKRVR